MSKVKVYIASSYVRRERSKKAKEYLEDAGYEVTSGWLEGDEDPDVVQRVHKIPTSGSGQKAALRDLQDIREAHVLMLFTDTPSVSGGMHVEFGYAVGCGLLPIIIGEAQNIFQGLPVVRTFRELDHEVLRFLGELKYNAGHWQH